MTARDHVGPVIMWPVIMWPVIMHFRYAALDRHSPPSRAYRKCMITGGWARALRAQSIAAITCFTRV